MKIDVKGVIVSNDDQWVYDMFEMQSTSPKNVSEAIEKSNGEDLEVVINSGGGDVFSGSEIFSTLKEHAGNVEIKIVGVAASAASVIAMAGTKVKMSPSASMMIHNSATGSYGDYNTMNAASEMLQVVNKTIAGAYRTKTGMEESELLGLMNKETWLAPEDAREKGFIDEIMFQDDSVKATASIVGAIPQAVIDSVRNGLLKDKQPSAGINEETLKQMFADFKEEITSELKQNNEPPKPEPTQNKMSKLFLNLK